MPKTGNLHLVCVGAIKTRHWKLAQTEYLQRLEYYTHCKLTEVRDWYGELADAPALQKEGERLLAVSADAHWRVALSPLGQKFTSPQLADWLDTCLTRYQRIAFLIGGPAGFSPAVTASVNEQISLSALTFPHELARVLFLEQLYRAFTIRNGESYHK